MAAPGREDFTDMDSGSDSDRSSSSCSNSHSSSFSNSRNNSPAPSGKAHSHSRSRSGSPARSGTESPIFYQIARPRSRKSSHAFRSESKSPAGSNRSGSAHSNKSGSQKSGSSIPKSNASGSIKNGRLPNTQSISYSGSPNVRSRSGSAKSRSASPKSAIQSPQYSLRSPSHSPKSNRSSKSQSRSKSGSESPKSGSRSGSVSSYRRPDVEDSPSNSPKLMIVEDVMEDSKSRSGSEEREVVVDRPADKKKRVFRLSDSESEEEPKWNTQKILDKEKVYGDNVTSGALFGDSSDISTDEEAGKWYWKSRFRSLSSCSDRSDGDRGQQSGGKKGGDSGYKGNRKNDTEETRESPETRIDLDMPIIWTELGNEQHSVKLPYVLSVETRPCDSSTYEDETDEEKTLDEEGWARLKLKVENTIRWRQSFDITGNAVKESNARLVKWTDVTSSGL